MSIQLNENKCERTYNVIRRNFAKFINENNKPIMGNLRGTHEKKNEKYE